MKSTAKKYLRLMREVASRRESEGALEEHEELRYAGTLDQYWREMDDDEQDYVEREMSREGLG